MTNEYCDTSNISRKNVKDITISRKIADKSCDKALDDMEQEIDDKNLI